MPMRASAAPRLENKARVRRILKTHLAMAAGVAGLSAARPGLPGAVAFRCSLSGLWHDPGALGPFAAGFCRCAVLSPVGFCHSARSAVSWRIRTPGKLPAAGAPAGFFWRRCARLSSAYILSGRFSCRTARFKSIGKTQPCTACLRRLPGGLDKDCARRRMPYRKDGFLWRVPLLSPLGRILIYRLSWASLATPFSSVDIPSGRILWGRGPAWN